MQERVVDPTVATSLPWRERVNIMYSLQKLPIKVLLNLAKTDLIPNN